MSAYPDWGIHREAKKASFAGLEWITAYLLFQCFKSKDKCRFLGKYSFTRFKWLIPHKKGPKNDNLHVNLQLWNSIYLVSLI